MPQITVKLEGEPDKVLEVQSGIRLVLALEDGGIDIAHRCGGNARCTTCRCEVLNGEPETMSVAEKEKLTSKGDLGKYRLSCQILTNKDMTVKPLVRVSKAGLDGPGGRPDDNIPNLQWTTR